MVPPLSGEHVNKLLEAAGMQTKAIAGWELTPLGKKFGSVAAKHIGLLKWREDVIPHLNDPNTQIG